MTQEAERDTRDARVLWIATIAAMAASWSHLVSWLASWEYASRWAPFAGAIGATSIDLGILAAMRRVDALAARGADATDARRTVTLLALISFVANVLHALDARASRLGASPGTDEYLAWAARLAGAVVAAGALPLIVIRLTRLLDAPSHGAVIERTADAASTTNPAEGPASQDAQATQTQEPRRDAAAPARRTQARGDASRAVLAAAAGAPRASRRELARMAEVGDATVRRMEQAGDLVWDDAEGWRVAKMAA